MITISLDNLKLPETEDMVFNKTTKEYEDVLKPAPIIIRDNTIICSGDTDISYLWLDYYGEYRGGYPWINPKLEAWAKENFGENAYWEWESPGAISLCIN